MDCVREWFRRHFSNPQVVALGIVLMVGCHGVECGRHARAGTGESGDRVSAQWAGRKAGGRPLAMTLVFILFIAALSVAVIAILPRLSNQLTELIEQFPDMVARRFEAQTA